MKTAPLTLVPVAFSVLVGLSGANAAVVKVGMALDTSLTGTYAPPPAPPRASGSAMPTNAEIPGRVAQPESVISPGSPQGASSTRVGGQETATETGPQGRSTGQTSGHTTRSTAGGSSARTTTAHMAPSDGGAKGGMPPAAVEYANPGALQWEVDAGWSSQHLWRGIDIIQFTSFNHIDRKVFPFVTGATLLPEANSDVVFLGVDAKYQGFDFGVKYIRSWDNDLNPYFSRSFATDRYEEYDFTVNYTRALVQDNWLVGTFGFDFYYYPDGEFWGVHHQGMAYARFSSPHYKWAQPFLDLFYNVPTTTDGQGLASGTSRFASGADLVKGYGSEFGVRGGDKLVVAGPASFGVAYSLSAIYKQGYAFEDPGLTHLIASLSFPIVIGKSVTISPAVTYVQSLQSMDGWAPGGNSKSFDNKAWNAPGWSASVRLSYTF